MDTLKRCLDMSPEARKAFEKDERRHFSARPENSIPGQYVGGSERMVAADAKRAKRRARNLLHCS